MFQCTLDEMIVRARQYITVGQSLYEKSLDEIGQALYNESSDIVAKHGGTVIQGWGIEAVDEDGCGPTMLMYIYEQMKDNTKDEEKLLRLQREVQRVEGWPLATEIIIDREEPLPPKIDHLEDHVPIGRTPYHG